MISPEVLSKHQIKFSRVTQYPGEYIVTFSGGYHEGFNCGWNEAEAINFGTPRWLEFFSQFKPCKCQYGNEMRAVSRELLPIVMNPGSLNKTLQCNICPKKFSAKNILARHIRECHSTPQFTCDICLKTFKARRSVRRHIKTSHVKTMTKFKCAQCDGKFTRSSGLQIHLRNVHKVSLDLSEVRNSEISTKNNDVHRWRKVLFKQQKLQCDLCKSVAHGKANLHRHMKEQH